jgi:hypothetical protein
MEEVAAPVCARVYILMNKLVLDWVGGRICKWRTVVEVLNQCSFPSVCDVALVTTPRKRKGLRIQPQPNSYIQPTLHPAQLLNLLGSSLMQAFRLLWGT